MSISPPPPLLTPFCMQVGEKESGESTLLKHQEQMREALATKVAEFKQLMGIVKKLEAEKQEQEGEAQWHTGHLAHIMHLL
jgi:hypothetical protein